MAITSSPGVFYQYLKEQGEINLVVDTLKAALMNKDFVFDKDKYKVWSAPIWQANTSYVSGETLIPTGPNGYVYRPTIDGTSASEEPTWPTTFGSKVTDNNDLEYVCWSYETAFEEISVSGEYAQVILAKSGEDTGIYEDEVNNRSYVHFDDIKFEASGEAFDTVAGCVIFDDSHTKKPVLAGIDFGTTYIVRSGNYLNLQDPEFENVAENTTTG